MPYRYSQRTVWVTRATEATAFGILKTAGLLRAPSSLPPQQARSILLVEPFGMGDVLSLSVMLDPLRQVFPNAEISVLVHEKNKDIYTYDRRVKETVSCPFPWTNWRQKREGLQTWNALRRTVARLRRRGGFDLGIDARGEIRSQIVLALAGCRRRGGYTNYMGSNMVIRGLLLTDNVGALPAGHRFLMNRLLLERAFGVKLAPPAFPSYRPDSLVPLVLRPGRRQVLIHPGAAIPLKLWKSENWVELAGALAAGEDTSVVFVGSGADEPLVRGISAQVAASHEVRITTYPELVRLVKGASLFVGLDSGPMNLAVTLGIPTVALFGPGDSGIWYPCGSRDSVIRPEGEYPCIPCRHVRCVRPADPCMGSIPVDAVQKAVQGLLGHRKGLPEAEPMR